ncbi:MAG: hypothetical protein KDC57_06070 [Saprospiraceae bacterium]|nr:hypothetical protein [Saprospiraceae bacterium]
MINFFRRKRKLLADDNKVLKYLRYAFGEIILVVLGILIALQINTWNQQRLEHALEQSYLKRLQNELIRDTTYLRSSYARTEYEKNNVNIGLQMAYEAKNNRHDITELLSHHCFFCRGTHHQ